MNSKKKHGTKRRRKKRKTSFKFVLLCYLTYQRGIGNDHRRWINPDCFESNCSLLISFRKIPGRSRLVQNSQVKIKRWIEKNEWKELQLKTWGLTLYININYFTINQVVPFFRGGPLKWSLRGLWPHWACTKANPTRLTIY